MPELVPECEYSTDLVIDNHGTGPFGNRVIATVTGAQVEGDRIRGTMVGAGGDWLLVGPDGYGRLDRVEND
jgi:hypothetical protein